MIDKKFEKRIIKKLRDKYPDDPAIAKLTQSEVRRVMTIFSINALIQFRKGFAIKFSDLFTTFQVYKRKNTN